MSDGIVTLLFTDLVGSTELLSRIGDEAAESVRRSHFRLLRDALAGAGGHEVKNLGDGLMAVFPSAIEGVQCAINIQQAVEHHNRQRDNVPLAVRVGLHVGEPVRDEDDYFGIPVVVAQRLCGAADGGEIVASSLVRTLVGEERFEFGEHEEIQVKGIAEPVNACRVRWARHRTGGRPLPSLLWQDDQEHAFVGREPELEQLERLWSAARGGERQVAFVVGEPGIGKSRLLTELARAVSGRGGLVLYGRCDEDSLMPYQPFIEALRPYIVELPAAVVLEELADEAGALARLLPELPERVPGIPESAAEDPATERYRLFESVVSLLSWAAASTPVLLLLDDLHWADKPTVLLLRHVVRAATPDSLMVLGAYRESEATVGTPLGAALADMRRDHRFDRIRLDGLDAPAVARLVEQWGSAEVAASSGDWIHAETEGNPLFISELVRHLSESDALGLIDGSARRVPIPEGVREVVAARISRLSPDAMRALSVAAVIGLHFDLGAVADVAELDEARVLDALDDATSSQLITESRTVLDRYEFAHLLIRRTLYDAMSTTRRARVHRRLGEFLERRRERGEAVAAAELAHHFGAAAIAGEAADKAVDYALEAGQDATGRTAYKEAAAHYRAALKAFDLSGVRDVARGNEILLAQADADWQAGDTPAAKEQYLRAAAVARTHGLGDQLARAALGYGSGLGLYGWSIRSDEELVQLLEQALALLPPEDSALRARLLGRLATELYYTIHEERRSALGEEAVAMARRLGDQSLLLRALLSRLAATWGPGRHPSTRLAECTEVVDLAEALDDRALALEARSLRIDALVELGDIENADEEHRTRSEEAAALRIPHYLADVVTYPAARALLAGDFGEAQALASRAVTVAAPVGNEAATTLFGAQTILLQWLRGELDGLVDVVADFADRYRWLPSFRAALAFVCVETGDEREARFQVESLARDRFAAMPRDGLWTVGMWALGRTCSVLGDPEHCAVLYDLLRPCRDWGVALGASLYLGSAGTPLGMLAHALGDMDAAAGHFEEALAHNGRAGARPFVADTQWEYARSLRFAGGDAALVARLEGEAICTAEELGMAGLLRRTHTR